MYLALIFSTIHSYLFASECTWIYCALCVLLCTQAFPLVLCVQSFIARSWGSAGDVHPNLWVCFSLSFMGTVVA